MQTVGARSYRNAGLLSLPLDGGHDASNPPMRALLVADGGPQPPASGPSAMMRPELRAPGWSTNRLWRVELSIVMYSPPCGPCRGIASYRRTWPLPHTTIGPAYRLRTDDLPPFIVAYMTQALRLGPGHRVLEIGTGSGYQAAVLAHIVKEVHTIEMRAGAGRSVARALPRAGLHEHPRADR